MKIFKKIIMIIFVLIVLIIIFATVDYNRVKNGEQPIFSKKTGTLMDGGTVEYTGFGYKIIDYHKLLPMWVHTEIGTSESLYYDDVKIGTWFMSMMDDTEEYDDYINRLINEKSNEKK